ncbi:phytanoyl-CoA dioxygenase family protein [Microlunatus ginsengisoli]|uniref:Phytanoyl-CoA dioxygenase family protein n=1 Tax=Microlunatus ginsengisoli TaxID=363863 RepID=A0ABP7A5T3_9ACTN
MITIQLDDRERSNRTLSAENVRTSVRALREDGFVLLEDVVDAAHLDVLHERMIADIDAFRGRPDAPYNWNVGNLQQDPPPFPPYLFADVLLNPFAIAVTSAMLGPGLKNVMYGGNTALPGDQRQPVHSDVGHLWPVSVLEAPHPPAQLVLNVLTVDVSPANGATEIWPGTHRELGVGVGDDIKITPERLAARRAVSPPFQPTFRRGSMLIRDIRLWHAGMPNRTSAPRPMIAMVHASGWLDTGRPLLFPTGTESFFDHPVLSTAARFTAEPIDYIGEPQGFEYVPGGMVTT